MVEAATEDAPAAPKRRTRRKAAEPVALAAQSDPAEAVVAAAPESEPAVEAAGLASDGEDDGGETPRRGWWQRTFGA